MAPAQHLSRSCYDPHLPAPWAEEQGRCMAPPQPPPLGHHSSGSFFLISSPHCQHPNLSEAIHHFQGAFLRFKMHLSSCRLEENPPSRVTHDRWDLSQPDPHPHRHTLFLLREDSGHQPPCPSHTEVYGPVLKPPSFPPQPPDTHMLFLGLRTLFPAPRLPFTCKLGCKFLIAELLWQNVSVKFFH